MALRQPLPILATVALVATLSVAAGACGMVGGGAEPAPPANSGIRHPDQVWVGPDYWANRLQDWSLRDGRIVCENPTEPRRTVHWLTRGVEGGGAFRAAVRVDLVAGVPTPSAGAGLLLGIGAGMDWRSRALVHHWAGPGGGMWCGVSGDGELFFRDNEDQEAVFAAPSTSDRPWPGTVDLVVEGTFDGDDSALKVQAVDVNRGLILATIQRRVAAERLRGGVAVISDPGSGDQGARFGFSHWTLAGPAARSYPERQFGPVAASQYTVHRDTLKLSAQLLPLRLHPSEPVQLQVRRGGEWLAVARARPQAPDYVAVLRVAAWDASVDTPVRVVVPWVDRDGIERQSTWDALVRRDPVTKPEIVVAGMTGNHNNSHAIGGGWAPGRGPGRTPANHWAKGIWFPHTEVVDKVRQQRPDLLFFAGEQVYADNSPTPIDRDNLALDYLYKWYLWCWAWGDLTRTVPSVCITDDHDVFQSVLFGQGGQPAAGSEPQGGYVHPPWFVRLVERTQTSHLPDPVDPAPVAQDIGVYFTELVWGRVGFAILEDRKFKSSCAGVLPRTATRGRPDQITDPEFDPARADAPGLELLGDRQLAWLERFAVDWRQQDMKMVLSQSNFASLSTHQGAGLRRIEGDLADNGWPQGGRRRALEVLRKGFALHVGGGQHLPSVIQHGVQTHGDALWSFSLPPVANFYPRAWAPDVTGPYDPKARRGNPPGPSRDGLGNLVTVRALANPQLADAATRGDRTPLDLYDLVPGHGLIVIDKPERTYELQCWPRGLDQQYPGWPVTVHQRDNFAPAPAAHLPRIEVEGLADPVVTVYPQESSEPVYSLRLQGREFHPHVFAPGLYRVEGGCPDLDLEVIVNHLEPRSNPFGPPVRVRFP